MASSMMNDLTNIPFPKALAKITGETEQMRFSMASEPKTGMLLRTLAATKRAGTFLELGTGTGLATAWILDGMDQDSTLTSIDNDERCITVARENLGNDVRLKLICADCETRIPDLPAASFDFIFADAWPGKYRLLEETLELLKPGGVYIIDDMLPQPNWPEGHEKHVVQLISELERREDFHFVRLSWASGIIVATKR